jgi:methyl-accepting chemotaxis protein
VAVPVEPVGVPASPTVEVREVVPRDLADDLQRHRAALQLLDGLKGLVVSDTEAAVVQLTEVLFSLVQNSKDVSHHIEKSLNFITDGDSGLGRTAANLAEQVRVFETLSSRFSQLKEGLSSDIGALTKAVGSINQFSETLSDLADQTNVLAINASIEAARVGIHGRGFAVIATQVQSLAKNSKEISEKMARTVREVVASVESSFGRQAGKIQESEALIHRSEEGLHRWADHVAPQLGEVGAMVTESRRLADLVTQELNDLTVSLQFQDRTKQILDHMSGVLADSAARLSRSGGLPAGAVPSSLRDEALREASRHFTIREEWALTPTVSRADNVRISHSVELF